MENEKKLGKEKSEEMVRSIKGFFHNCESRESRNRQDMIDDLRFTYQPGAQWEANVLALRQGRPNYSYNRVIGAVNQMIGEQRSTRPKGQVRANSKKASRKIANIFSGIIRNIESTSGAEQIYDEAFKFACAGAWGAWRIVPVYADDDSFDQELRLHRIPNPLTVYFDDQADPFGRGAMRCVVAERIAKTTYDELYDGDPVNLPISYDSQGWFTDKEVRIAESYEKFTKDKKLVLLNDGRTRPWSKQLEQEIATYNKENEEDLEIVDERDVKEWWVRWCKIDGNRILEGPIEYKYKHIPVIRLPGRHINIEGEQFFQSLIRHSKDPARSYNYHRSTSVEMAALTPRAPYLVTGQMVKGYEQEWQMAHVKNRPYLRYNTDPNSPDLKPYRERPIDIPQALIALSAQDAEDIKQTTGFVNPALDQPQVQGPESGRALRTRQANSDTGSFEFLDNFSKAVQYTWEILVNMIPIHYDTERVVRIIGEDGKESEQLINGQDEEGLMVKLSRGQYDVTVTLGPAYATQRMESLDRLVTAAQSAPIIGEIAPDIIVKNLDVEGADEIEKRIRRRLIMSGVVEPTQEEAEELPEPPPPDPQQEALTAKLQAQAGKDEAAASKTRAEIVEKALKAEKVPLEMQQMVAEIVSQQLANLIDAGELGLGPGATQRMRDRVEDRKDLQIQQQARQQQNRQRS